MPTIPTLRLPVLTGRAWTFADDLQAADILPHERVEIYNVTNGERLATYAIPGAPGRGEVCVNGAAAHLVSKGDLVILATYAEVEEDEARGWLPRVVFVDAKNRARTSRVGQPVGAGSE